MDEYPTYNDIEIGTSGPKIEFDRLDISDFVKYAGASGDFARFHYDEIAANEAGHETVLAQGMLLAGYASTWLTDWLGPENVSKFETRFVAPVYAGETITVSGIVTEKYCEENDRCITIEFMLKGEDSTVAVKGAAEVALPLRQGTTQ